MKKVSAVIAAVIMCLSMCLFMMSCGGDAQSSESSGAGEDASGAMAGSPNKDYFLGGWGYIEGEHSCNTIFLWEEDGNLEAELGGHPGGGYDLTFDLDNVSIKGDVLTCTEGEALTDVGTMEDVTLVARPSSTSLSEYEFVVTFPDGNTDPIYSYRKVASSRSGLDKWIKKIVDM